jgi:trafficking protein particle complex subunit 11
MLERGCPFCVNDSWVEEPTLDARLSFIRRQSGLDARAALFVLSPLSTSELNEFVARSAGWEHS